MRAFLNIKIEDVEKALNKNEMQVGVAKYTFIMDIFYKVNCYDDLTFKVVFTDFYKLKIGTDRDFLDKYFRYLEYSKYKKIRFEDVLTYLYTYSNKMHGSFASKIVATIDPNLPIIDKFIRKNLELTHYFGVKNGNQIINQYYELIDKYKLFLKTQQCKEWIKLFDLKFPNNKINDVKKIDFIIWQIR